MNWNSIYKGILSIFILVPLIYAQNEDKFVLNGTEDASVLKDIKDLKTLEITEREITQEDVNILCNLNSLETLFIYYNSSFKENVNLECLKDLQIKTLQLDQKRNRKLLKYFPNLESLYIAPVLDFYQEELENIVAMKNLNELTLFSIRTSYVNFETIKGTSNVRVLNIMNNLALTPNFFKIFSQLEKIYFNIHNFNQQEADGFKTLKNLKDVDLYNVSCYDWNTVKPLDFGIIMNSIIVNKPEQTKDFKYNCLLEQKPSAVIVTQEDINRLCDLIYVKDLTLNYSYEEDINFECFKDLDIKKLNVTTEERPKDLLKNFPKLEILTLNSVNILYQEELETIVAMKNLRNLTLNEIKQNLVDFESITHTSNIRNLKFYENVSNKNDYTSFTPNFFKIFSEMESFDVAGHLLYQEEIDGFKSLKNLKEFTVFNTNCNEELDFGSLKDKLKYTNISFYLYFISNCIHYGLKEDGEYYYVYNPNRNKCLYINGKGESLTYGDCNDDPEKVLWNPPLGGYGTMRYGSNPNCCLYGGGIACSEGCIIDTKPLRLCTSGYSIRPAASYYCSDLCLGPTKNDPNHLTFVDCDGNDPDQVWEYYSYNSTTGFILPQKEKEVPPVEEYVYIYNADRNECLTTSGVFGTPITYGKCDNSDNTVWITSNSNDDIRSKANPTYCISPNDGNSEGDVILGECSTEPDQNQFKRSENLIKYYTNASYTNTCIGSSEEDPSKTALIRCNEKDPSQIWYFNKWDPSVVIKETAMVYFYNAYKDECIHTDGSSVTMGSCDFNDDSLWEIPNSHKGYYRSKANPEKCLSVVDDKVSLTECNEDTRLYLDGNFIRSSSSKDHCIATSTSDHTLEYIEGCDISDANHLWYANIWESPETK